MKRQVHFYPFRKEIRLIIASRRICYHLGSVTLSVTNSYVVVKEDFSLASNSREAFLDDRMGSFNNVIAVDNIVEKMKQNMSSKQNMSLRTLADYFPDLHQQHHESSMSF